MRIRRALVEAVRVHHGIPVLAPELVWPYKSKAPRPIDEADFARIAPVLRSDAGGVVA